MSFSICVDDGAIRNAGVIEIGGRTAADHAREAARRRRGAKQLAGVAAPPKPIEVLLAPFQPKIYVEFGTKGVVAGSSTVTRALRLKNPNDSGDVTVAIQRFPIANKHFASSLATNAEVVVAPGEHFDLTLTWAPQEAGGAHASFGLVVNGQHRMAGVMTGKATPSATSGKGKGGGRKKKKAKLKRAKKAAPATTAPQQPHGAAASSAAQQIFARRPLGQVMSPTAADGTPLRRQATPLTARRGGVGGAAAGGARKPSKLVFSVGPKKKMAAAKATTKTATVAAVAATAAQPAKARAQAPAPPAAAAKQRVQQRKPAQPKPKPQQRKPREQAQAPVPPPVAPTPRPRKTQPPPRARPSRHRPKPKPRLPDRTPLSKSARAAASGARGGGGAPTTTRAVRIRQVLYDEQWREKQEDGFTSWMNYLFLPPHEQQQLQDAQEGRRKAQPRQSGGADDDAASVAGSVAGDGPEEAAAGQLDGFRGLLQKRRDSATRRRAFRMYHAPAMERVLYAVDREVAEGKLRVRGDRELFRPSTFCSTLFCQLGTRCIGTATARVLIPAACALCIFFLRQATWACARASSSS